MEEQDYNPLNADDKTSSVLLLHETDKEKTAETNSELNVHSEVYTNQSENEVITIISEETDGEVYVYDRNNIDAAAENTSEYIQVCDSNNTFDEVNSSDEKLVNVDVVEEGEESKGKETEPQQGTGDGKEVVNEEPETRKEGEIVEEGNQSKNFKNVILEDWEVEVPQVVESHESSQPLVEEPEDQIPYNNENDCTVTDHCTITEVTEEQEVVQNDHPKDENLELTKEQGKNPVNIQSSKGEKASNKNLKMRKSPEENSSHCPIENSVRNENDNNGIKDGITPQLVEKRLEALKCPKSVTKEEIVKILDDSSERVIRPIVGGKDLFFSIELTKRLNQKLSHNKGKSSETKEKHNENDSWNNNNTVDDRQKIVEILEADEIKDWKSTPSKSDTGPKENGNDMEISKAIKSMEERDSNAKTATKTPRKTPLRKLFMDKELERTIALQQLREEFPTTRKRSRTSKNVNHVPFLASTVLEKAMTSPEVTTALKPGPPRRRPCYLPENVAYAKSKDDEKVTNQETVTANTTKGNSDISEADFDLPGKSIPNSVVKTYSAKRKSTDAENEIKTTLEAVAKALNESSEETNESKPKKQKTVTKENKKILLKKKRKLKPGAKSEKKMKSELEKLLGDEGAVRMLYDTQHGDATSASPKKTKFKTTTGLKKDLVLKTKLVRNAVMRLSGVGADGIVLRGKRRSNFPLPPAAPAPEEEPLFSSTPNIVLYKPKKKQRAEASRILYRHSSSESFDSSEGYRRTSFDAEGMNAEGTGAVQPEESRPVTADGERNQVRRRQKKSEVLKKRLKNLETAKQRKVSGGDKPSSERLSTDSVSTSGSRLNLSNVPVRKSSRPRVVSKKYSIWSSTSMDSLSVESLGLKKLKKASTELGKKLNCKELTVLQYEHLVQVVLTPTTTIMKNSLNCEVLQELVQVLNHLSKEESCRAVLLSSRGSTFCQGVDINRIVTLNENERKKGVSQLVKAIREFVTCLAGFKKPVLAGVQGAAIGLGVTLLPYCDLIISSDTASFFTPYVKLGQAPEGAPIRTFPLIGRQLVSELLFKSQKMSASDALKLGLVTQVIPEERFEEDLIMISRNLASQPVQGMQSIKFLMRKNEQWDVTEALEAEGQLLEEHWNSSECLNNMIKFLNSGELQLKQQNTVG